MMLENKYSVQLLHTDNDGLVFGNPIQDSQRDITLISSIIRLPL